MLHQGKTQTCNQYFLSEQGDGGKINSQNYLQSHQSGVFIWSTGLRSGWWADTRVKSLWTATHTFLCYVPCSRWLSHTARGWSHGDTEVFLAVTPSTNVFQPSPPPPHHHLIKPSQFSKEPVRPKWTNLHLKDSRPSSAEPLVTAQDIHAPFPQTALKTQVGAHSFGQTRHPPSPPAANRNKKGKVLILLAGWETIQGQLF